jgi:hypothetical protein
MIGVRSSSPSCTWSALEVLGGCCRGTSLLADGLGLLPSLEQELGLDVHSLARTVRCRFTPAFAGSLLDSLSRPPEEVCHC